MKLYLAGPMRGLPDLNRPLFHRVAAALRAMGHEIFSPGETAPPSEEINVATGGTDLHPRAFWLRLDINYIAGSAEGIALLPGWENSPGASLEMLICQELELPRFTVREAPDVEFHLGGKRSRTVNGGVILTPLTRRYAVHEDGARVLAAAPVQPPTVLEEAGRLVNGDREKHYGHPRDNFRRVAAGWTSLLDGLLHPGAALDGRMVARMLTWLKLARDVNLPSRENLVDGCGYLRCAERLDEPEE